MTRTSTRVLLGLCLIPAAAFAQSDRQVAEDMVTRAANVCPGHSSERTTPTVKKVPVGALRVMLDRGLVMCPDRRLDAAAPAVFYGRVCVRLESGSAGRCNGGRGQDRPDDPQG